MALSLNVRPVLPRISRAAQRRLMDRQGGGFCGDVRVCSCDSGWDCRYCGHCRKIEKASMKRHRFLMVEELRNAAPFGEWLLGADEDDNLD